MNPSTAFATVLVDELVRCGLAEAVIAPGSRSAPLAMALHAASSAPETGLRLHVRIDERSASFLALGLAKASGRPVAVVCTSGTAAAHFHAAVIEADEAGVPLIVLTADRPPELRGTGANQTIDQIKLYGDAVRWFCEAGVPEDQPGQVAYWRSLACRAWSLSAGNGAVYPGPVHLNLPFRDPLVPDLAGPPGGTGAVARAGAGDWHEPLDGRAGGQPWTRVVASGAVDDSQPALDLDWTERGLVVAGDGAADPAGVVGLAEAAGWPLLAEPSSGARRGPGGAELLPVPAGQRRVCRRVPAGRHRLGRSAWPDPRSARAAAPRRRPPRRAHPGTGPVVRPGPNGDRRGSPRPAARPASGTSRLHPGSAPGSRRT